MGCHDMLRVLCGLFCGGLSFITKLCKGNLLAKYFLSLDLCAERVGILLYFLQNSLMPSLPVPENSSKSNNSPGTASAPAPSASKNTSSLTSPTNRVNTVPFSVLSLRVSQVGNEVEVRFSDQRFIFLSWWLYLYRKSEGLPSIDGCKNPSTIVVRSAKVTGVGIRATVDITWNTGTTSQFPVLYLRVFGPTKALEQERWETQLPEPSGRNPRSGVEQLTLDEKRVADRYRAMLIETMKEYMDEDWISEVPTSLLREMLKYVEIELQSRAVAAQAPGAEASQNDARPNSG